MKINIIWIIAGVVALLFFTGTFTGLQKEATTENGLLEIELYDANMNLIQSASMKKEYTVDGTPNIQYISLRASMTNDGTIDLPFPSFIISIPENDPAKILNNPILNGFKQDALTTFPVPCNTYATEYGSIECFRPELVVGATDNINTGLINIDLLGVGTHTITVRAEALDGTISAETTKQIIITEDLTGASIRVEITSN